MYDESYYRWLEEQKKTVKPYETILVGIAILIMIGSLIATFTI